MKHRPLLFLVLPLLLLAMTLVGFRLFSGSTSVASAHVSTGTVHLEIDMVQDAGGTWCNPVQDANPPPYHGPGDPPYQVAICLTDAPQGSPPAAFQFSLAYNTRLNQCVDKACGDLDPNCLDSNPDANAAASGGTTFNGVSLGTRWNCNIGDVAPSCGAGTGQAFLQCNMTSGTGTLTLPTGPGVSEPIAVITFTALYGGTDDLTLQNVEVDDSALLPYVQCFGASCNAGAVFRGTDNKSGSEAPTATPTFTPAPPTATPAYCGNPGQPQCTPTPRAFTQTPSPGPTATATAAAPPPPPPPPPPSGGPGPVVSPPSTGDGPSDLSWSTPLAAAIAAIGAVSLVSGGLYVRYARKR